MSDTLDPKQDLAPGSPYAGFSGYRPLGYPTGGSTLAPYFIHLQDYHGFDAQGAHDGWQMVPVGGSRGVLLRYGDHLKIYVGNPDIATITETDSNKPHRREIWIAGHKAGQTQLVAVNPGSGATQARLVVRVYEQKTLKLGFYRLSHQSDATITSCEKASKTLLPYADEIYRLQANLRLKSVRCEPFEVNKDWKDVYKGRGSKILTSALLKEIRKRQWKTDEHVHVILCPTELELDLENTGDTYGYYFKGTNCLAIEDLHPESTMAKVLAHEIGHHFFGAGHRNDPMLLMVKGSKSTADSKRLNRAEITNIQIIMT